jgi:hypothetical protein
VGEQHNKWEEEQTRSCGAARAPPRFLPSSCTPASPDWTLSVRASSVGRGKHNQRKTQETPIIRQSTSTTNHCGHGLLLIHQPEDAAHSARLRVMCSAWKVSATRRRFTHANCCWASWCRASREPLSTTCVTLEVRMSAWQP